MKTPDEGNGVNSPAAFRHIGLNDEIDSTVVGERR
jgi:hypothetical protein